MRFRTKVDRWLVLLLVASAAVPISIALAAYVRVGWSLATWLPLAIVAVMVIIIFVVAIPTHYEVQPNTLVIQSGFLRWEVPRADILSVTPTSNPLSSPAWSLDRLEVRWVRAGSARSILISPQRTEEFLRELAGREGTLVSADGQLQRVH